MALRSITTPSTIEIYFGSLDVTEKQNQPVIYASNVGLNFSVDQTIFSHIFTPTKPAGTVLLIACIPITATVAECSSVIKENGVIISRVRNSVAGQFTIYHELSRTYTGTSPKNYVWELQPNGGTTIVNQNVATVYTMLVREI